MKTCEPGTEMAYALIFEEAPIGMAFVSPDYRILRANRALSQMLGYSEEQLTTRTFVDITHPDDISKDALQADRLFRQEIPNYQMEKRYIRKDGRVIWGSLTVSLVRGPDGEPRYALGMVENITERKKVDEQLREAQKMESAARVASGIAHDFNNLLTVINGYSDLLQSEAGHPDRLREGLEEIGRAGDRAAVLMRQLLAFGRKQRTRTRPVDLRAVVADTEKMIRRVIGEEISLTTRLDPACGQVLGDRGEAEQVLLNLVLNARDAMPSGGALCIAVEQVFMDLEAAVRRGLIQAGPYVVLSMTDTGTGMSPEVLGRIFEPYFTTKPFGRGTGLGLSTVRGIVEQWGGKISIRSKEGSGTGIQIFLQRLDAVHESERMETDQASPRGSETILLVEDDRVVRTFVSQILLGNGYEVIQAHDGAEAVRFCEEAGRPIHLLLTDVVMPGMNGREIAGCLMGVQPGMKTLYMSGYSGGVLSQHGLPESGPHLLDKPFTASQLLRRVRQAMQS